MLNMVEIGKRAKNASYILSTLTSKIKNDALEEIAKEIVLRSEEILKENQKDIKNAKENNIKESMVDRLLLTKERIEGIATSIRKVIALDDPVGYIEGGNVRPNGMEIIKKRVPLGVVGIIFESRPNVTIDAAGLCLKSGNACILRGGKEAINTNMKLADIMREAISKVGLPKDSIILLEDTNRKYVKEMAELVDYIDILIPRGSANLINSVKEIAKVPFIETGAGNCHIYIDESADIDMAVELTDNGKTQRPSVCNALETLLINKNVDDVFLHKVYDRLKEHNVEFRGDEKTIEVLGSEKVKKASEEDYMTEYNDYIIAVKTVDNIDEAIEHINKYSTHHSECIVTNNYEHSLKFTSKVDSACVYVNVSTRFTDGEQFGLGSEIGISTAKLHVRGPMGLNDLTTVKYIINGNGQIRE